MEISTPRQVYIAPALTELARYVLVLDSTDPQVFDLSREVRELKPKIDPNYFHGVPRNRHERRKIKKGSMR